MRGVELKPPKSELMEDKWNFGGKQSKMSKFDGNFTENRENLWTKCG